MAEELLFDLLVALPSPFATRKDAPFASRLTKLGRSSIQRPGCVYRGIWLIVPDLFAP